MRVWALTNIFILAALFHGFAFSEEYTKEEKDALKQFRPLVADHLYRDFMKEDFCLIRWIRDRGFNLNAVAEKLIKALKWRQKNNIDTIVTDKDDGIDSIAHGLGYKIDAYDNTGSPVLFIEYNWDIRKIAIKGKVPVLNRYIQKMMETAGARVREIRKTNLNVTEWVMLADYAPFNLRTQGCLACIPFQLEYIRDYENYFTGETKNIIAINMPRLFDGALQLLRPAMSPSTRKGFLVYSSDRSSWDFVNRIIPAEQLTPKWGGTKKN